MVELAAKPWPEVSARGLLIPVGSTEQHGPHLPVDVDTVVAEASARHLAARLADLDCLVAPGLAYGASGEHAGFPGTISMGATALQHTVVELVRSVADWADWTVLVNGHGGNANAVSSAVSRLRDEGHRVGWVPCAVEGGDAHAGRTETSLMLHLDPERVDLAEARPGNCAPVEQLMPLLRSRGVRAVSPSGVLGDPTGATAREGRHLLARMVDDQERRVRIFAADANGMLVRV